MTLTFGSGAGSGQAFGAGAGAEAAVADLVTHLLVLFFLPMVVKVIRLRWTGSVYSGDITSCDRIVKYVAVF